MFKLTIVTPEKRVVLNVNIDEVTLPGFKGELNILPGHAPMVTTLTTGPIKWKPEGSDVQNSAIVSGGYCQVSPEGINVLANFAETPGEIEVDAKNKILVSSEKRLLEETLDESELQEVRESVARARAAIELVEKMSDGERKRISDELSGKQVSK